MQLPQRYLPQPNTLRWQLPALHSGVRTIDDSISPRVLSGQVEVSRPGRPANRFLRWTVYEVQQVGFHIRAHALPSWHARSHPLPSLERTRHTGLMYRVCVCVCGGGRTALGKSFNQLLVTAAPGRYWLATRHMTARTNLLETRGRRFLVS